MHKNNNRIPIRIISSLYSHILMVSFFIFFGLETFAQSQTIQGGKVFHFTSVYTCFPETKRLNGYTYDSVLYDFANHYSDSSVLIVAPDNFKEINNTVDIVFWFHGWHNSIDTALDYYHLASQFISSKKYAVLVLAEASKNAPDSYGGKLEQPDVFKNLLNDVLQNLKKNKIISASCQARNIILAGHSGAYRVIAYMLENGGVVVHEVYLFDALYSQTDKFMDWIKKDTTNKFINFYTDSGGGTKEVSEQMMNELKKQNFPLVFTEENNLTREMLRSSKIIFVHTTREHNDIIFNPDNFKLFLENSPFLKN
ncbi:MAG TPA: hypothetical protein VIH86_10195 [Puia sp.]